jgi:hypothetical protein
VVSLSEGGVQAPRRERFLLKHRTGETGRLFQRKVFCARRRPNQVRAALDARGWRVAFLIGTAVVPIGLHMRRNLPETIHDADRRLKTAEQRRVLHESNLKKCARKDCFGAVRPLGLAYARLAVRCAPAPKRLQRFVELAVLSVGGLNCSFPARERPAAETFFLIECAPTPALREQKCYPLGSLPSDCQEAADPRPSFAV